MGRSERVTLRVAGGIQRRQAAGAGVGRGNVHIPGNR